MNKELTAEAIEAAFAEAAAKPPGLCRLGVILKEHPALTPKVMDVASYDGATISRVLKGLGLPVSRDVVNRHRKETCVCTGTRQPGGHR
jgi:hypothetical protein